MTPQTSVSSTTLAANTFARYGYTFVGWNTDQNGNGISYTDSDTFPFSSDTILYAQWQIDPNAPTTTVSPSTTAASGVVTTSTIASRDSDGVVAARGSKSENLPTTGSDVVDWGLWATLLMAFGSTLLWGRARLK